MDWKVSASDFNMVPTWWLESLKFEIQHGLPLHGIIPLPWHGPWFRKSCFAGWANPCRSPCMGSVCENHTHVKPMTSKGAIGCLFFCVARIWISGYLEIWISGYLDSGKNNLLLHPQSGLLCGAALPVFFSRKNTSMVFLQPKTVFLAFY